MSYLFTVSNISDKVSDSSKSAVRTLKQGMFNEPQKDYTDGNDAGFELPPTKRGSLTEGRHDSRSQNGAKMYSPKRSSVTDKKISLSIRNTAESEKSSSTFKDDKPKTFDGSDLETGAKLSKQDPEHIDKRDTSNKRGSFTPDRVDLLSDKSRTGSKVISPRQSVFNEQRHVSAEGTHGDEPLTMSRRRTISEGSNNSRNKRKSVEATMSAYERNSVKGVSILDMSAKNSTLSSDIGSRTHSQKHISRDGRADSKGEFITRDIDRNYELNMASRQPSTISGEGPRGRSGIDISDDPRDFFDDVSYGGNIKYTNGTETDIPTLFDTSVPAKSISSFVYRTDSKPSISSFRQLSLTGSKREPLDDKGEENKRSFSYYGENRSGSTYTRTESGTRMHSSKEGTYNKAKSDYTGNIDVDKNVGVIKYDSFFDTHKVDSFIKDKSDRSRGALYQFEDDQATYSKANKRVNSAAQSHSRSMDRDDTYINKRISHEEEHKEGKGKTYSRFIDANTDFRYSKNGSRGKVVKYSAEDDSKIAIIGREINRTLSFIYEHELIPLQHVIKGLKEDIDVLAGQQVLLREKLHGPKRVRPVGKCGCCKRYDFSSILE